MHQDCLNMSTRESAAYLKLVTQCNRITQHRIKQSKYQALLLATLIDCHGYVNFSPAEV